MRYVIRLILLIMYAAVPMHAQSDNDDDNISLHLYSSYGYALELNGGNAQNLLIGVKINDGLLHIRYTSGKEWSNYAGLSQSISYPIRSLESWGVMYARSYDDLVRFGAGIGLSRGNRRGQLIGSDRTSDGTEVLWYDDFAYRSAAFLFEAAIIPYSMKGFNLEIFLRGEYNGARTHAILGVGIGYTLPNF